MKKFLLGIACFLSFLFLFVAVLPLSLSTTAGKNLLLSLVNSRLQGTLLIDELSLQWLGGQSVKGIQLQDASGASVVSIEEIDADASLLSLLSSSTLSKPFHVRKLDALIGQDAQGVTNLESIFKLKASKNQDFSHAKVYLNHVNADLNRTDAGFWTLKAAGVTRQSDLKGQFNLQASIGSQNSINLSAQNFPLLVIDQSLALKNGEKSGSLVKIFGDALDLAFEGSMKGENPSFSLHANSNFFNVKASGTMNGDSIVLDPSSEASFAIPGSNIASFMDAKSIQLDGKVAGTLKLQAFSYNLNAERLESLQANLLLDPLSAKLMDTDTFSLNQFSIQGSAKDAHSPLHLVLKGNGSYNTDPLSLEFSLDLNTHRLSSIQLSELLDQGIPFKGTFKGPADLTVDGKLAQAQSEVKLSLGYKGLEVKNLALLIDTLPLDSDSSLKVAFKGSGVSHEKEKIKGSLYLNSIGQKEFDLDLSMENFNPQILKTLAPEHPIEIYTGSSLNGKLTASRLANGNIQGNLEVNSPKDAEGFMKKMQGSLTLEPDFDLIFDLDIQQKIGSAHLTGSIHELFDSKGQLAFDQAEINIKSTLRHFPIALVSQAAFGDKVIAQKLEAILGSQVDADLETVLTNGSGPIKADVKGLNGKAHLDGAINQGFLFLQQPLTASLKITPQLEKAVLRDFIPFLSYVAYAEEPIELTIAKEGFQFPLRSPTLFNVSIPQATLNLHSMQFNREGHLGKVAALLGINSSVFEVRFTPVYFSLTNGQVTVQRTDMLIAQNYPLASWGQVDFNRDSLRFIIGLTPAALQSAFKVKTAPSYMLQIPVKGSISRPEIDTAKVTTRISALIAQSQGGPQGLVLGTVLDAASGSFTEDGPPPPTTNPLPWNTAAAGSSNNDSLPEKIVDEPVKIIEKPVKELQKGAKKLIKGLFG